MPSGDDIEDDYVADSDVVVFSEAEGSSQDGDYDYEEFQGIRDQFNLGSDDHLTSRKRQRRERVKEKKAKRRKLATAPETVLPSPVASQNPADAQVYISAYQAKAFPKHSVLELEGIKVPEDCLANTTSYTGVRTLDHIGDFITECLPQLMIRLGQKSRDNGAPTLIFVAGAALRVADITRMMRRYRGEKGGEVAKLFARHFKLQEHIMYLKRTKVGVAVGTPARLGHLLEKGALSVTALTHIILDVTYRDAKNRSMMDIPETRDELFHGILSDENVRTALQHGTSKLVLF